MEGGLSDSDGAPPLRLARGAARRIDASGGVQSTSSSSSAGGGGSADARAHDTSPAAVAAEPVRPGKMGKSKPGPKPGSKPGPKPGSKPGPKPGSKPGPKPGKGKGVKGKPGKPGKVPAKKLKAAPQPKPGKGKGHKRAAPDSAVAPSAKVKRKRAMGAAAAAAAAKRRDEAALVAAASSGDEYSPDLLRNYIGQTGACAALGLAACDVLDVRAWRYLLTDEERESLRALLPPLPREEVDAVAERVLGGESLHFGSARDRVFDDVVAGLTHPRVRRWRQRVALVERRHHLASLRDYHNRAVRTLSALKTPREAGDDALAHLAMTGGGISKAGDALLSLPERVEAAATAAARSPTNDWDVERWRRVLSFRNQETARYQVPERAFVFRNPWGRSIVGPLKRGPAIDGGRPREHDLLRNERPSHVTILCIVRDAASRLPNNRGTRAEICDLLRDSQYLREGATFQQLNTVVSGALDRLHYEVNAPVRYDNEAKEWCYLHNDNAEEDFEVPEWAIANGLVSANGEAGPKSGRVNTNPAAIRMKRKKQVKKKNR